MTAATLIRTEATIEDPAVAAPPGGCRGRVVMLVTNPCVNDSRVIRSAETVAGMGYEVVVLATAAEGVPESEARNGVTYRRVALPATVAAAAAVTPTPTPPRPAERSGAEALPPPAPAFHGPRHPTRVESGVARVARRGKREAGRLMGDPTRIASGVARVARRGTRSAGRLLRQAGRARRSTVRRLRRGFNTIGGTARAGLLFRRALDDLRPDIIHAHDFATLPVAARAARRLGALCIYDSHELEMHRNVVRNRLDHWLSGRLEARHIRSVDAVVTVCDSIADHLAHAYSIDRPVVVMNAPDIGRMQSGEGDLRTDIGLAPDVPLAVYVGRISVGRGIERLAEALDALDGVHLALLGTPHPPTVAAATEIAARAGTADRLHVLPPVPPHVLLPYIASADVSVAPIQNVCLSYYYCLPNKLIESTIAGLPIVVSDFPEMRRYVELGRCGVTMDPEDPADIARAVREAYDRRAELRLDPARRALIEAQYGWETQRQKLVELYRRLHADVDRPPRRP